MARIAIVGMACLFPGAPDLRRFWQNICEGVDAISEVPAARWDPSFHDPDSKAVDRFYCRRGGFVDEHAVFDPLAFGIMPRLAEAVEPDQLLALRIGYQALRDAGYEGREFARERTGVIIGRGNYVSAGVLRLEQHVRLLPQILQTLRDLFPDMSEEALTATRERLQQSLSYYGPDAASGLIPNLVASRLANRLDLQGPAYTVDAACASSLLAVEQACAMLASGDADMMLVGGVHLSHDLTFWATFCQLGALSRRGVISPLSAEADGILAGEGVGMAVLKRLEDALADGDRIYAVIEGTGSSSDGRASSLVAPSVTGQHLALERAWRDLPFARTDIGLLEAHGTGTPTGDDVELETLARFFGGHAGDTAPSVIGSVKSMIGHAMPASGMASLIKTALAIHQGVLPPTLHCRQPHPRLADTRFRVLAESEPWTQPREDRIAGLNAFGFGGINAHVVLRGLPEPAVLATGVSRPATLPAALMLSADDPAQLLARLDAVIAGQAPGPAGTGDARLLVLAPDSKRLAMARKAVVAGKPWPGRQQIWFTPRGLLREGGKIAFVFPGVDSVFSPRADDIATHFGKPLPAGCETLDPAENLLGVVLGLLGFNRFLHEILGDLGITPDAFAGHSIGEWSAMLAAGMMDQGLSDRTNAVMDSLALSFPDVRFIAAACDAATLTRHMTGIPELALSHDNCPHQAIACGSLDAVAALAERLRADGLFHQVLPIVSGFHSPLFAGHLDWYREFFSGAGLREPVRPVWSATSMRPFPPDEAGKCELALAHLVEPVRFRGLIETLHDDGFRVFIQVGTGSLPGFINDTLSGRPHLALHANHDARTGLVQLQQLCAALWVEGGSPDLGLLRDPAAAAPITATPDEAVSASTRLLSLGVPLLRVTNPLPLSLQPGTGQGGVIAAPLPAAAADDAVGQLLQATLGDIERAGRDVLAAWSQHRRRADAPAAPPTRPVAASPDPLPAFEARTSRYLDIASTIPWVRDHELYPQRAGWPVVADRHPVVPMTMEVMMVREAVEQVLAERGLALRVVAVRAIQAYSWLAVARPLSVDIVLRSPGGDVVQAEIVGYFKAEVVVSAAWPAAPAALPALQQPRATAVTAAELYQQRWMFHGPAYQGVEHLQAIGENGIDGRLRVPEGRGALLDNMGQLAGYWVMEQPENSLAMPIGVDCIHFHGSDPVPGESLSAQVRIRELDDLNCVSDHVLHDAQGRLRISISGWRTRRYQMDKPFWEASRLLSEQAVSKRVPPNVTVFDDHYDTAILRDYISRRYLTEAEREVYQGLAPRRRRQWLAGRVAAKDAVLSWLRDHGTAEVYPQELRIVNNADGAPQIVPNVTDSVPAGLHVSLAHKDHLAAAIVGHEPVGIDIERIEVRDAGFLSMVFSTDELDLLLGSGEPAALAHTRGWVAKEVMAKVAGTGLGGHLREVVITARDGDCLCINGRWVVTHALSDYVMGWSLDSRLSHAGSDTPVAAESL